jgi:D-alanyl-D-alanine carboxypeptidase
MMLRIHACKGRRVRIASFGLLVLGLLTATSVGEAAARTHRHHLHTRPHASEAAYQPPYAAIVVDGNTGHVLHAANPDSQRHPASLTKIMTLFLLFEQLEAGKLKLDSRLLVSPHAAAQDPSKLGLEPGETIAVEDAIKAVATKSANDAAVVIAEAIGSTETDFARMMTRKAHALGMMRTVYVNASGLPNDDQLTTARDQALLGRVIRERFPKYYRYFSTLSFQYQGVSMRNHNHLLGRVDGVDGIKTGYTVASGFNLVASVHRGDRQLIAVVLGGTSGSARDAKMRSLIEEHIAEASTRRTAGLLADASDPAPGRTKAIVSAPEPEPHASAREGTTLAHVDATTTAALASPRPGSAEPIEPIPVKTIAVKPGVIQAAAFAPLVSAAPQATMGTALASRALPGPPSGPAAETESPALQQAPPGARPGVLGTLPASALAAASEATTGKTVLLTETPAPTPPRLSQSRGPWMIQVGAFSEEAEAKERLKTAKSMAQSLLGNAESFTERVVKGSREIYRARFAGLDKEGAEAACHYFHRNDIACMALRN